jgi:hypothetical protein
MSMEKIVREEARLVILRHLAEQQGYSSNSALLETALAGFGIVRSRDWLHEELRWLRDIGAVDTVEAGTVHVARLLPKGLEHVERKLTIAGVKRPSPEA